MKKVKQYWVCDADGELWDVSLHGKRSYAATAWGVLEEDILDDPDHAPIIEECIEKKMSIMDWLANQGYKDIRYDPKGDDVIFFDENKDRLFYERFG